MLQARLIKYLPHLVLLLVLVAGAWIIHTKVKQSGFREGAASVQVQWEQDTKNYETEITRLQKLYAEKEEQHRTENKRIAYELSQANQEHAVRIATLESDYARRLQLSSNRASIYQRQAEGGAIECRDLASHASRLDASLEEGRSLVRELRATLGLRDQQLKALSDQIRNDRKLQEN